MKRKLVMIVSSFILASGFARNCNAMCFACGYLFSKTVLFTAGILSLTQERCKHTPDVTQ